mmetsp:Transcript_5810/g.10639  ORF Transcript_5810/g.10639 Transcript_5810/m.10639 type:complete len:139 (+) Transcript_5810:285-701(+)
MGGGNAQKSAAAREKNLKNAGKTPEQRAAASAKAAADREGFKCKVCMTTFMINVKPPTLYLHMTSKHPEMGPGDCGKCFDSMADYDPADPDGKKAAAAAAKCTVVKKKKAKKPEASLDDLLSAGLSGGKKTKKGKGKK